MNKVLILLFWGFSAVLWAQNPSVLKEQKILQHKMIEVSLSELQMRLNLTEKQMSQLKPVYTQYQYKVARLNMLNHRLFNRLDADTLSNEQSRIVLQDYLDRDKKLYNLKKQYTQDLLHILSPQQVIKLYQSDSAIKRKIKNEYQRRAEYPRRR
ncbi:hypothetical protein [Coprobacter sp.]